MKKRSFFKFLQTFTTTLSLSTLVSILIANKFKYNNIFQKMNLSFSFEDSHNKTLESVTDEELKNKDNFITTNDNVFSVNFISATKNDSGIIVKYTLTSGSEISKQKEFLINKSEFQAPVNFENINASFSFKDSHNKTLESVTDEELKNKDNFIATNDNGFSVNFIFATKNDSGIMVKYTLTSGSETSKQKEFLINESEFQAPVNFENINASFSFKNSKYRSYDKIENENLNETNILFNNLDQEYKYHFISATKNENEIIIRYKISKNSQFSSEKIGAISKVNFLKGNTITIDEKAVEDGIVIGSISEGPYHSVSEYNTYSFPYDNAIYLPDNLNIIWLLDKPLYFQTTFNNVKFSIYMPNVTLIPEYTFSNINLVSIDAPNVTEIWGASLQLLNNLKTLKLPKLKEIKDYNSIQYLRSLVSLDLPELEKMENGSIDFTNENFESLQEIYFPKLKELPYNLFNNPNNNNDLYDSIKKTLTTIDLSEIKTIPYNSFSDYTSLTTIKIPNVTKIENNAFKNTPNLSFENSVLPSSITKEIWEKIKNGESWSESN
ncbi:leucine-rich repeat domain-containing protein [Mycoplasma sp. CSL7503-lung]|uniref:leucine-rich repeat domain-containing protein n=1 Tax=Mycoplasma sp. CSL7503-lung TaxID=536372 RepID=UPI0021D1E56D|nr:leucine-rich repeat domain-containing protein [Mycoplasma sp. CSL7503-lung]MCU4706621.1 leucine-rich repeat domain-containing protein [Mycoplasma sp. CSL7503-lung]